MDGRYIMARRHNIDRRLSNQRLPSQIVPSHRLGSAGSTAGAEYGHHAMGIMCYLGQRAFRSGDQIVDAKGIVAGTVNAYQLCHARGPGAQDLRVIVKTGGIKKPLALCERDKVRVFVQGIADINRNVHGADPDYREDASKRRRRVRRINGHSCVVGDAAFTHRRRQTLRKRAHLRVVKSRVPIGKGASLGMSRRCLIEKIDESHGRRVQVQRKLASVFALISSSEVPGAISRRVAPAPRSIPNTAKSVISKSTTPVPVNGRVHRRLNLGAPPFSTCSIRTTTRGTPATRSMAPPIPLTIFPGTVQFARYPFSATCSDPRIVRSMCPPRIIPKLSADEK